MMAPRGTPPSLADRVRPRPDVAEPLAARDRAFFYRAFHVDEVL